MSEIYKRKLEEVLEEFDTSVEEGLKIGKNTVRIN